MRVKDLSGFRVWLALAAGALALIVWQVCRAPSSAQVRPNILLISIDTLRADHLGCYGDPRPISPSIDALAEKSILFEKVVTPVPLTLPAHSSMMTGTIPPCHGVHDNTDNRLAASNLTLAEILKTNRYSTAAVVASYVLDSKTGMDQGFETYLDEYEVLLKEGLDIGRRADETTRLAAEWLEEHANEKFFLFVHYFDPHSPYDPPEPFAAAFPDDPYSGEVAYTDHAVGRLLQRLKDLDLYDSALLIVTADHGEMLGEHGEMEHGFFIYESAIRVPLIVKLPGQQEGRRITASVSLVDIAPTVCAYLGLPALSRVQGEDLSGCFTGRAKAIGDRPLYCESFYTTRYWGHSLLGVVAGAWKYIRTTRPELYDIERDPRESDSLVDAEPERARALDEVLEGVLKTQSEQARTVGVVADPDRRRRIESLGYAAGGGADDYGAAHYGTDPKDLIGLYEQYKTVKDLVRIGDYEQARSLCARVLAENPGHAHLEFTMAEIALDSGAPGEAIAHFSRVLSLMPGRLEEMPDSAVMKISYVHQRLAEALAREEQYEEALVHLEQARAIESDQPFILNNIGTALLRLGRRDEAIRHWIEELRAEAARGGEMPPTYKPGWAEVQYNLGSALLAKNEREEAIRHWHAALELKPDWPDLLNDLAWLLTVYDDERIRDPQEAMALAQRACELTESARPDMLDSLAAAFAAAGRFPEAIETAHKAIDLAEAANQPQMADRIRRRLDLYRNDRAYFEADSANGQ